jgi:hypothetical protein
MEKNNTHLAGEFFVAAELFKRDFQVSMTLGNAKEVDLIIRTPNKKTMSIQVKALQDKNCFTLAVSKVVAQDFYVFVFLYDDKKHPDYFILKGSEILSNRELYYGSSLHSTRQTVNYGPLFQHKNRWDKLEVA